MPFLDAQVAQEFEFNTCAIAAVPIKTSVYGGAICADAGFGEILSRMDWFFSKV
jgi:hypothetical protein